MSDDNFGSSWYDELDINGHTYSGRVSYQRHGGGMMNYRNGKSLSGNWENNIFVDEEHATIEYDEPRCVYIGSVVVNDDDVLRDGEGTLEFSYPDKYVYIIGTWNNDELVEEYNHTIKYKNGNIYIGEAYNEDIDDFYRHGKGTMTFNYKKSNKNKNKGRNINDSVQQVVGTWDDDQLIDKCVHEIKYINGDIYVGNAFFDVLDNNNVFPYGEGTMTFCSDSIIMSISGTWNEYGILCEVEKIVYNTEKIEMRSELNHSIRDAAYLPITNEKSVLGKRFRKAGENFNKRNDIVSEIN